MRPSRLLRTKIRLVSQRLDEVTSSLWLHPDLRARIPEVLLVLHDVARASVPLMASARAEARRRAGDAVADGLLQYLDHHIHEEEGHDRCLLEDLEVLGVDRSAALRRVARPSVARLIGAQSYWIEHNHPVALLGYMAVIEGDPPTVPALEGVIERTGLPREAFRTWLHHARLDPDHMADLDATIDALPLDEHHLGLLSVSALHTVSALAEVFTELLERAGRGA